MAQSARKCGIGREGPCKALTPGARARYYTARKVIRVLGVEMHVSPRQHKGDSGKECQRAC